MCENLKIFLNFLAKATASTAFLDLCINICSLTKIPKILSV